MPPKSKSKTPPKHRFVRAQTVRMATAVRIVTREFAEQRAALDEATVLKARYERTKA